MGKTMPFSIGRLKEIARRQDPPLWGQHYIPAIRATREEAPSKSRFSQIWSRKLRRFCHALSTPEQCALLIALHHPKLFELQEQRVLHPGPRLHPLFGHTLSKGLALPPLCGTVPVCERLDMLDRHAWVWADATDGPDRLPVPIPFIGDFLLFLLDETGPYCVNWTVKAEKADFERSLSSSRASRDPVADERDQRERHAIEEQYYADAGIPTIRVAQSIMPSILVSNLRSLLLMQHRHAALPRAIYRELCERLQASVITGQTPFEVILPFVHRHDLPLEVARSAYASALLAGDVNAELMDCAVLIDIPLKRKRRDPWQVLAPWFSRAAT